MLRICFVLGNITVNSAENRKTIYHDCNGVDALLPLLVKCNNLDLENIKKLDKIDKLEKSDKSQPVVDGKTEKLQSGLRETEQVLIKVFIYLFYLLTRYLINNIRIS